MTHLLRPLPSRQGLPARSRRRGVVALMILAILSVLLLLVVTFTRTSKLEQVAATNYLRTTQSRIAAATGLPAASPLIPRNRGLVWNGQNWNQLGDRQGGSVDRTRNGGVRNQDPVERSVSGETPQGFQISKPRSGGSGGEMAMRDLAGSVNVNYVASDAAFGRFLRALSGEATAGLALGGRGATLSSLRDYLAKRPATQTSAPVQSLSQLADGNVAGIDRKMLDALAPHLTVFSLSPEVFNRADGAVLPKVPYDPENAGATLAALQAAYPDKPFRLLAQVAADLRDAYVESSVPTLIPDPDFEGINSSVRGMGGMLRITEVYPDSATGSVLGDAGQYVEIWNGTTGTVGLAGWSVGVATGDSASTPTERLALAGLLPPGGFVAMTDNYDEPDDAAPAGAGSFVSIFGVRGDGGSRLVIRNRLLNLPDTGGTVALFDPEGRVADVFSYGEGAPANSRMSYQRPDPARPAHVVAEASPLRAASVFEARAWTPGRRLAAPVYHPADILGLDLRYSAPVPGGNFVVRGAESLVFGAAEGDQLDQSILDVFSAVGPERLHLVEQRDGGLARFAAGRLNLNTCGRAALFSIDDGGDGGDVLTEAVIAQVEQHRQARQQAGQVPFRNASDLLPLVFKDARRAEPALVARLLDQVAVGSASFEVVAEYYSTPTGPGRRPSVSRQRWVVAFDQDNMRRIVDYDPQF